MVSVGGGIAIAISVLLVLAVVGWVGFTQLRARKLGLPPPTLSSYIPWKQSDSYREPRSASGGGGVRGWFGKLGNRNKRSAAGAYEQSGQQRGFGGLDPDDAWDSRVHDDGYGYYEERELEGRGDGFGHGSTEYSGAADYGGRNPTSVHLDAAEERGRTTTRGPGAPGANPFDDDAASSLRDVSPRPMGGQPGAAPVRNSLEGRRSAFREEV
ncbi:unnamed protein product [Clonostachys byssicola]|uniref:Acid phosphatase-like protein n=1 Tax=Clonostachys byssicola TaxID=160290 RepID=A0A9N9Y8Q6_9HYPO|nr:unnamed protein product [Clonostachys byssicola]